jgi:hypothetical protein
MGRFSLDLRGGFWAVALATAFAFGVFQLALQFVSYVLYPIIYRYTDLDLSTIPIRLAHGYSRSLNDPYDNSLAIYLGPELRIILAGLLTLILLGQLYRMAVTSELRASTECPYCLSLIPFDALRCRHCGADQPDLEEEELEIEPELE